MRYKVWDPAVRVFHWSLVAAFAANALFIATDSNLHLALGYTIVGLVALRVVWGFAGRGYARFASFPPDLRAATMQAADMASGRRTVHLGHTPLGSLMIYNILLALAVIAASGYAMTTSTFFGVRWIKDLHEASVSWAEISAVIHVAAVIWESRRTRVNLPLAMVTGYKEVPDGSRIQE
ncbi:MAG: cytochrome b/b6 domain-containing protein [Gemmobacter sp.]